MSRFARVQRATKESEVLVELEIDGTGVHEIETRHHRERMSPSHRQVSGARSAGHDVGKTPHHVQARIGRGKADDR